MKHAAATRELVAFFETVTPATVSRVRQLYAADATFKDPFSDVRGIDAIEHLYAHMFEQVKNPRFVVVDQVAQNDALFLIWDFLFLMPPYAKGEQRIRGVTHFRFDEHSRIASHRDYWDAAEELYEKLPVVSGMMRVLKWIARR